MTVSAIDYAVLSQAILAAAREMGAKLIRSAYSTILREARDGSAAILDRDGNTVAQAELIPMQLGTIGAVFQACAREYDLDEVGPDDFFVINDSYSGGQHLQDVFFFHPIFAGDRRVGFAASVAHHLDIGGGSPGLSVHARDVHSEGIIIPPTKFSMSRDWNGGMLERILRANVRAPLQTMGDFNAQIAANRIGAQRIGEMCERYGAETVEEVMAEFQSYTERRVRAAIAEAPDGVYLGEAVIDDDGVGTTPVRIKSKVTIEGDRLTVDYTGTDPQVSTNLNAPLAAAISATMSCVKSALTSPDIPFNAGLTRSIDVIVPEGSILNPRYPAPVRARMESCYRAFNATMNALSQAVPEKVIANGFDCTTVACLSWLNDGAYSVYLEIFGGGYGASVAEDGCDAIDGPMSNCANTPVEAIDQDYEFFRVEEYALTPDSFGHGTMRGGTGFVKTFRILRDGATVALYADRFTTAPQPLFGGEAGTMGACEIHRGDEVIRLTSKDMADLKAGDLVVFRLGGGAGYGPAADRPAELVADDLRNGLISEETARTTYPAQMEALA
ncbi:MAG: methylhydantoinase [Rhodobacteraceae bacterium]|jgi:N-methylhydantoinase B|uniref:N-methylhydantoinase B n=1 Tax=Salipiger profundus TaxID=1229727 RepID=A0A1U7D4F8_9RHOB|nr:MULTISPECIES: hydantoinase B/oxoprolinase family protein [Salipiger]APX23041.1 N-methylhydantoinase B [Salipiger profundus]MAB04703.1 methylhydantoinase [Paracoccaceae bacterium]GGA12904.1 methylhydantoinase [Salipiger profundus]SFD20643.1 N-methylhydantoinase B [Salipiger profundus]